jgi:hypothetical protein
VNTELEKTSFDKISTTATSLATNSIGGGTPTGGGSNILNNLGGSEKKKKIGKSPIIGQPRLFGGKLIEYLNATKQELPQIITSCIKAINRLGLHNQGIFRIPGSQLEINQFKEAFEKGEDPLVTVNPREMNSVAGVLKLYLRELKDPLFPRDLYDSFIGSLRVISGSSSSNFIQGSSSSGDSPGINGNDMMMMTNSAMSPIENIESMKIDNIRKTMSAVPKQIYIVIRYLFAFLNQYIILTKIISKFKNGF